jgi:hypothetical protein
VIHQAQFVTAPDQLPGEQTAQISRSAGDQDGRDGVTGSGF